MNGRPPWFYRYTVLFFNVRHATIFGTVTSLMLVSSLSRSKQRELTLSHLELTSVSVRPPEIRLRSQANQVTMLCSLAQNDHNHHRRKRDSGWSYLVCACATFCQTINMGLSTSFGVLFPVIIKRFHSSRQETGKKNCGYYFD